MADADRSCNYVLDPDHPETWEQKGTVCHAHETVLDEDGVWRCPHDAPADEKRCIFHQPVERKDDSEVAETFLETLRAVDAEGTSSRQRTLEFLGATFGEFDLSGRELDVDIDEAVVLSHATVGEADWSNTEVGASAVRLRGASFEGGASFTNARFHGAVDFENASFGRDATFLHTTVDGDSCFAFAQFDGDATFAQAELNGEADFSGADFHGRVDFGSAVIHGKFDFSGATVRADANFSWAQLGAEADFIRAKFRGHTKFDEISFADSTNFAHVTFDDRADFSSTEFGADADFQEAQFGGSANFPWTEFIGHADFAAAGFASDVTFKEARLLDGGDFSQTDCLDANFRHADVSDVEFSEAHLEGADFTNADLSGAGLERTTLSNADLFGTNLSGAHLYGARIGDCAVNTETTFDDTGDHRCVYDPNSEYGYRADNDEVVGQLRKAMGAYHVLEQLTRANTLPDEQSVFFTRRQDMRRAQLHQDGELVNYAFAVAQNAVFRHGESFSRIVGWSVGTIVAFALLYPVGGWIQHDRGPITYDAIADSPSLLWESIHHSALLFLTGGGPLTTTRLGGEILVTVEAMVAPVLLALLVFVLGRRAAR